MKGPVALPSVRISLPFPFPNFKGDVQSSGLHKIIKIFQCYHRWLSYADLVTIVHCRVRGSQLLSDRCKGFASTGGKDKSALWSWMDFYFILGTQKRFSCIFIHAAFKSKFFGKSLLQFHLRWLFNVTIPLLLARQFYQQQQFGSLAKMTFSACKVREQRSESNQHKQKDTLTTSDGIYRAGQPAW